MGNAKLLETPLLKAHFIGVNDNGTVFDVYPNGFKSHSYKDGWPIQDSEDPDATPDVECYHLLYNRVSVYSVECVLGEIASIDRRSKRRKPWKGDRALRQKLSSILD